jgi:hypothetical protein
MRWGGGFEIARHAGVQRGRITDATPLGLGVEGDRGCGTPGLCQPWAWGRKPVGLGRIDAVE